MSAARGREIGDGAWLHHPPQWPLSPSDVTLLQAAEVVGETIEAAIESAATAVPLDEEIELIATFHAVRALRCLRAVIVSCRAGYAVESSAIARSLLEDAVSLRYLSLKPVSHVRQWLRFDETRSLEYWRLSERLGLGLQKSDRIRELESRRRSVGNPVWWSNKTPSAMAREIKVVDPDLHQTFKALYPWLSDVTHANIKTTNNYYFMRDGREPALRVGPSDHLLHLMLDLTVGVCVKTCLIAHELGMRVEVGPVLDAKAGFDALSGRPDG